MGFLNDFGRGFSEGLQKRIDLKDQQDAKVKAEIQLIDYKDAIDSRKKEKEAAELARQRESYLSSPSMSPLQPNSNLDSTGLPKGTQDTPAVATPTSTVKQPIDDYMSQFSDIQNRIGKAWLAKDPEAAKFLEAQAEILKQKQEQDKYKRTTAREDTTGVEGLTPAKELIKEDTAVFSKNELNTGLYEKYFGEPKALNYANPSDGDVKDINEVKKASKQASKIASILTSASADQATGKSTLSSEELKSDAVNLVKNKNILLDDSKSEQHDAALSSIHDILQNYPEASHSLFKTLELDKVPTPAASTYTTQPVTLSSDKPTGITQAEYMQLPSGATYTAPDGTTRTKP